MLKRIIALSLIAITSMSGMPATGMPVTGIPVAETATIAIEARAMADAHPPSGSAPSPIIQIAALELDDASAEQILELQRLLSDLGYNIGRKAHLDAATQAAVEAFIHDADITPVESINDLLEKLRAIHNRVFSAQATIGDDRSEDRHSKINVYYATDRQKRQDTEEKIRYSGQRGQGSVLNFGKVTVRMPKDHRIGELESPKW